MTVVIRKMRVDDLSDVKRVDALTWDDLKKRFYPDIMKVPPRTDLNILSYLHSDPDGAFVAADDFAGIIGSTFSHVWGRTGWTGPVSVLPSYQGIGVGKELLKASFAHLEGRGCSDIGLETMPENQASMGLYLKVGLRPVGLVLVLGKRLFETEPPEADTGDVTVERLSASGAREPMMAQMRRVSGSLSPGLDYSSEVLLTESYGFGETLVATAGERVAGFCVVHTAPRREEMPGAAIKMLAVDPGADQDIAGSLLTAAELFALESKSIEISLPVPAVCRHALDMSFSRGYVVMQSFERLMWRGIPGVSDRTNNLCTWSG